MEDDEDDYMLMINHHLPLEDKDHSLSDADHVFLKTGCPTDLKVTQCELWIFQCSIATMGNLTYV